MIVELASIDCTRNRARGYRLTEGLDLFGEPYVKIQWGRVGRHWSETTERFSDSEGSAARLRALLACRLRRGYVTTRVFAGA